MSLSSISVYILLFLILVFEGLGLPNGRLISRCLILGFPAILFIIDLWKKKPIFAPKVLTILFIFFSFSTAISTIKAVNIQTAFEHQLYYGCIFLIFLYVYNHQKEIKHDFYFFVFISSIVIFFYIVFVNWFLPDKWWVLIPQTGYQFVYLRSSSNNHYSFGAFVLIPLIILYNTFFSNKNKIKLSILVFSLFILLLFSFLRSAYIAFILTALMIIIGSREISKKSKYSYLIFFVVMVLLTSLSFISITSFNLQIPFISDINHFLTSHFELLKYKSFLNSRDEIAKQALEAITSRPLTGFGSYNFYYASMRFADSYSIASGTSHNIFLDIFTENGILGGLSFGIIITLLMYKGWFSFIKNQSIDRSAFSILVALLILFQLGHYHKFYFLFLLFFVGGAILYVEDQKIKDTFKITTIISVFLLLFAIVITLANMYYWNKKYVRAYKLYPISLHTNQAKITENLGTLTYSQNDLQLQQLYSLYSEEPVALEFIGNTYKKLSNSEEAVRYYELALQYSPYDMSYLVFIYEELEKNKPNSAKKYIEDYLQTRKVFSRHNQFDENMLWFYKWCERKGIKYKSK